MLLAIDVGNTRTKAGLWNGSEWLHLKSFPSDTNGIQALFDSGIVKEANKVSCASVVPTLNPLLVDLVRPKNVAFLDGSQRISLKVNYNPPSSLGADRLANAYGVMHHTGWNGGIAVDFGTATKIEIIDGDVDADLAYLGGCILPGVQMSAQSLTLGTAQLPSIDLLAPPSVIGTSTSECLQSGVVFGHARAVDGLLSQIESEFGNLSVFATGGYSDLMLPLCETKMIAKPTLTLDGIVEAYS